MDLKEFIRIREKLGFTVHNICFCRADACPCNHDCDNDCDYCDCQNCGELFLYTLYHDDNGWYINPRGSSCEHISLCDNFPRKTYLKDIECISCNNGDMLIYTYDGHSYTLSEKSIWEG